MNRDVFIAGTSALRLYRTGTTGILKGARPTHHTDLCSSIKGVEQLSNTLSGESDALQAALDSLPKPLQLLAPAAEFRTGARGISIRTWSGAFPSGSFRRIGKHVFVASPVFVLVLMATKLGPIELAMLGLETCGTYAYDRDARDGFVARSGLASVQDIADTCMNMSGSPGIKPLRTVAPWILDNARSPMEAELSLRFCLRQGRGGYGLPQPELNPKFTLAGRAAMIAGARHVYPDLFWRSADDPNKGLDVEYLGYSSHVNRAGADSRRRNALLDMGVNVIEVTKNQVNSAYAFDAIARTVRKKLGMKPPAATDAAMHAHAELGEELARIRWQGEAGRTE